MICGVVFQAVLCAAHSTQYTHHSLKYLLPQHRKSYNDVFLLINSTRLSISFRLMVHLDRNM